MSFTPSIQFSPWLQDKNSPSSINVGKESLYGKLTQWAGWHVCIILLFYTTAQAAMPEELDVKWGLPLSEFRQMEMDITEEWPIWNRATAVRLGPQAQHLANAGSLILVFDNEFGLVKTHWASPPIDRDATGSKGMQLFDELKTKFIKQYGLPQETHEEASVKLQGFIGNFYQCLLETSCGRWESIWETPEDGVLILELVGLDNSVGFVQMTHQGPNLQHTLQQAYPGLHANEQEI